MCGYKVFLRIYPNGRNTTREGVDVALVVGPGQFDDLLTWPAEANLSFDITNFQGGTKSFPYRDVITWNKPENLEYVAFLTTTEQGGSEKFFILPKFPIFC